MVVFPSGILSRTSQPFVLVYSSDWKNFLILVLNPPSVHAVVSNSAAFTSRYVIFIVTNDDERIEILDVKLNFFFLSFFAGYSNEPYINADLENHTELR